MKASRTIVIIVAVVILIPAIGFISWYLKKGSELEIFFVHKSMTDYKNSENKSFNWILNNRKILRPGRAPYKMDLHYYGVHIEGKENRNVYPRLKELDRLVEKTDLFYYSDVSGILASELGQLNDGEEDKPVYGGFNNTDYILTKKALDSGTKYIAECNYFGFPTEPLMRYNIEQITDIYWLGWAGKYSSDLSIGSEGDACFDYRSIYEENTGGKWEFTGPGIILMDQAKNRVVVLREGVDINVDGGFIYASEEAMDRFDLSELTSFDGWFSMLHPGKNKVLCKFDLNATEAGKVLLKENGIPDVFPALIERNNNFYFLAGDFGKTNVKVCFSRVYGINNIINAIRSRGAVNPSNFFYTFYKPLISGIIDETLSESDLNEE